jgi:cob(I)alamin adenosyltransferase
MKVYTKTGDSGETSLYDGSRAPKFAINFIVLGEMDELSSRIGMLCAMLGKNSKFYSDLRDMQVIIQDFNSHIATLDSEGRKLPKLSNDILSTLEENIDKIEETNTKLTKFILPGVTQSDAQAHLCRTQARKAERALNELHNSRDILTVTKAGERSHVELEQFTIPQIILQYMNRLSDFFFVLARNICVIEGVSDCFVDQK